jgi:hypothetical protein
MKEAVIGYTAGGTVAVLAAIQFLNDYIRRHT